MCPPDYLVPEHSLAVVRDVIVDRALLCLAALVLGALGVVSQTAAHEWYTDQVNQHGELCCGGGDCGVIPGARVRHTLGGYDVEIVPGTHPRVRAADWRECYYGGAYCTVIVGMHTMEPVTFHFEGDPGISPDGEVHACIDGSDLAARRIRCLFLGGVS